MKDLVFTILFVVSIFITTTSFSSVIDHCNSFNTMSVLTYDPYYQYLTNTDMSGVNGYMCGSFFKVTNVVYYMTDFLYLFMIIATSDIKIKFKIS